MQIVVIVRQVRPAGGVPAAALGSLFRSPDGVERDLDCGDASALELGVRLGEAHGDADVLAVLVGPREAAGVLTECLAAGADRGLFVEAAGAEDLDPLAKALVYAAAIAEEAPDLVVSGAHTADDGDGAAGVALAVALGYPWVAMVDRVVLTADGRSVTVNRVLDQGGSETLEMALPAVVSIQSGVPRRRDLSAGAIRAGFAKPLRTVGLADLGLGEAALATASGSRTTARRRETPTPRPAVFEGDAPAAAEAVATVLRKSLAR